MSLTIKGAGATATIDGDWMEIMHFGAISSLLWANPVTIHRDEVTVVQYSRPRWWANGSLLFVTPTSLAAKEGNSVQSNRIDIAWGTRKRFDALYEVLKTYFPAAQFELYK